MQLAAIRQINTINVVRLRDDFDAFKAEMEDLVSQHTNSRHVVVHEQFLRSPEMRDLVQELGKPKLGLNCVGGRAAALLARHLAPHASLITYGGMSKQPLSVPVGLLIFNDIRFHGFWMTRWNEEHSAEDRNAMLDTVADLIVDHKIQQRTETLPLESYQEAFKEEMGKPKFVLEL
eukprot:m.191279 g.191279  ORF g.191279 m.191279 type:complete len:176 (+) comp25705_c0_seq24:520-1047(+)